MCTTYLFQSYLCITSGVSAGQTIPHKVLCSCLGFASFPSLPIGEFKRRRWESVDAKVRRFNTFKEWNNSFKARLRFIQSRSWACQSHQELNIQLLKWRVILQRILLFVFCHFYDTSLEHCILLRKQGIKFKSRDWVESTWCCRLDLIN